TQHNCHLNGEEHTTAEVAVQCIEPSWAVLQQNRRWSCLPCTAALIAETLPLRGKLLRITEESLPVICDSCDMLVCGPPKVIHNSGKRCLKVPVHALPIIRAVHEDGLRKQLVAVEQATQFFARCGIEELLEHDATVACESFAKGLPVEPLQPIPPFIEL